MCVFTIYFFTIKFVKKICQGQKSSIAACSPVSTYRRMTNASDSDHYKISPVYISRVLWITCRDIVQIQLPRRRARRRYTCTTMSTVTMWYLFIQRVLLHSYYLNRPRRNERIHLLTWKVSWGVDIQPVFIVSRNQKVVAECECRVTIRLMWVEAKKWTVMGSYVVTSGCDSQ